jgi:DNA-damage-inducible protein J
LKSGVNPMAGTAQINTRIDNATKKEAVKILHSLGLTTSQAITMFFKQIIYTRGIPFELKIPNDTTIETFRKTDANKDLHRVSSVDELSKELKS